MISSIRNLFLPCFMITVVLYGFGYVFLQIVCSVFPFGLVFALCLIVAVHILRVPFPDPAIVEAIIGKDPLDMPGTVRLANQTIAHRGAGMDAPENSLEAFQLCKDKGCEAIEFDVALTADGVPIIFHDSTLERMTGREGVISKMKWVDLKTIDISVNHAFRERFTNTYIPTLDQCVKQLLMSEQHMIIDVKDTNKKMVEIITELFKTYPELYSTAVVTSLYPNIIYYIRRKDPKIICTMAWRPYELSRDSFDVICGPGRPRSSKWHTHCFLSLCDIIHKWMFPRITYYLLGIPFVLVHKHAVSGESIVEWRNKGVRVVAWPVNTPVEKQYFAKCLKVTYLTDTLTGEGSSHILLPTA